MIFEICCGAIGIGTTVADLVAFGLLGSIAGFVLIVISFFSWRESLISNLHCEMQSSCGSVGQVGISSSYGPVAGKVRKVCRAGCKGLVNTFPKASPLRCSGSRRGVRSPRTAEEQDRRSKDLRSLSVTPASLVQVTSVPWPRSVSHLPTDIHTGQVHWSSSGLSTPC